VLFELNEAAKLAFTEESSNYNDTTLDCGQALAVQAPLLIITPLTFIGLQSSRVISNKPRSREGSASLAVASQMGNKSDFSNFSVIRRSDFHNVLIKSLNLLAYLYQS